MGVGIIRLPLRFPAGILRQGKANHSVYALA
jgi:hypothetical protein